MLVPSASTTSHKAGRLVDRPVLFEAIFWQRRDTYQGKEIPDAGSKGSVESSELFSGGSF